MSAIRPAPTAAALLLPALVDPNSIPWRAPPPELPPGVVDPITADLVEVVAQVNRGFAALTDANRKPSRKAMIDSLTSLMIARGFKPDAFEVVLVDGGRLDARLVTAKKLDRPGTRPVVAKPEAATRGRPTMTPRIPDRTLRKMEKKYGTPQVHEPPTKDTRLFKLRAEKAKTQLAFDNLTVELTRLKTKIESKTGGPAPDFEDKSPEGVQRAMKWSETSTNPVNQAAVAKPIRQLKERFAHLHAAAKKIEFLEREIQAILDAEAVTTPEDTTP